MVTNTNTINAMTMTTEPASSDEIRSWLQRQIQARLATYGIAWLEQPLQAAIAEREEIDREPLTAPQRETIAEARRLIHDGADQKLSWLKWSEALDAMERVRDTLDWMLPGERGSRARELDDALDDVTSAIRAAAIEPGSEAWRAWTGYDTDYTAILTEQPYYRPWLDDALDAWLGGADLAIENNRLVIVQDYRD